MSIDIGDIALEIAEEVYGAPLKGGAVLRMREFAAKFLARVAEQNEPVVWASRINKVLVGTKFYQSDIYDIPLYLHPPKPDAEEGPPEMSEIALTIRDLEFERDDLKEQITRHRAVMEQALTALEFSEGGSLPFNPVIHALRECLKEEWK